MPSPPLRNDFVDTRSPLVNEVSAAEYNLNATRTDAAYDNAATAVTNAAAAQGTANAAVPASGLTESVQDIVGSMVVPGTNITKSYDDIAGTLTINATSGGIGEPDVIYPTVTVSSAGAAAANTTAINTAINAAFSGGGGVVRLPKGAISHNGLVIPDTGLVQLKGSGKGTTRLVNEHATNPSILCDNTAGSSTCRNWSIRDLAIDASATRATQIGIDVHLAVDWDVRNVRIIDHGIGIRNRISWAGSYNDVHISACTTGFLSQLGAASAPLVFNNVNIYDCDTGFWSEDGLTGFSWHGGTIANSVTCGARFDGFSNGTVGFFGVDFESNTSVGDDVQLGDADSGPISVLFDNCVFHAATGSAHPRSVYARFGNSVTFNTCYWRDEQVLAVAVGSGMGTVTFINPRFNGVTTHVTTPTGSYQIPSGTSVFTVAGFGASAQDVQRSGAGVAPIRQVVNVTPGATPAINVDTAELFVISPLSVAITSMTSGLTGTPFQGQRSAVWVKDDGTARAITWGAKFSGPLPTTTVVGETLKVDLEYDSVAAVWVYRPKAAPPDIQIFATTGTWTRPAGVTATSVTQVIASGASGGGGSGAREPSGTASCGGGGGGAGATTMGTFKTLDLTSTVAVTIATGGAGGAAQTTNGTAGIAGSAGSGATTFGSYLQAGRGFGGGGGGAGVAGTAGLQGTGTHAGGPGAASSAAGNTVVSAVGGIGSGGGGSGGGISSGTPTAGAGGSGGTSNTSVLSAPAGGAATGAAGSPGAVGAIPYVSSGGGGGGASTTAAGGTGGAGGTPGGGGGGGGASLNGQNSGAGGVGGDGYCVAVTYF